MFIVTLSLRLGMHCCPASATKPNRNLFRRVPRVRRVTHIVIGRLFSVQRPSSPQKLMRLVDPPPPLSHFTQPLTHGGGDNHLSIVWGSSPATRQEKKKKASLVGLEM